MIVIALRGIDSIKEIRGKPHKVRPFVGADREGKQAQIGIGMEFVEQPEKAPQWGASMLSPIRAWRAIELFKEFPKVGLNTFMACWTLTKRGHDKRYLDELIEHMGAEALEALREKVLATSPSAEVLDEMITALRGAQVPIDTREIEAELRAGTVRMTPIIEKLIADAKASSKPAEAATDGFRVNILRPPTTPVPVKPQGRLARFLPWL